MGGLEPPTQGNKRLCSRLWMAGSSPAMVNESGAWKSVCDDQAAIDLSPVSAVMPILPSVATSSAVAFSASAASPSFLVAAT